MSFAYPYLLLLLVVPPLLLLWRWKRARKLRPSAAFTSLDLVPEVPAWRARLDRALPWVRFAGAGSLGGCASAAPFGRE